jgi:hypothetical protein
MKKIKEWFKEFNSILNEINLLGFGPKWSRTDTLGWVSFRFKIVKIVVVVEI